MSWIIPFKGVEPAFGEGVFIAPGATVIGDVVVGEHSSIWYGCVLRGDVNSIRIGKGSNIQDRTVIHVTTATHPTVIGDDVTIGHACVLHGCTLEDGAFVGMSATVMDGAVVESGGMVAAGALVTPGKIVRKGELWGGSPARLLRQMSADETAHFARSAPHYAKLAKEHLLGQTAGRGGV